MWHLNNNKFKINFFLLLFLISVRGFSSMNENYVFEYNDPKKCKTNEYFNLDSLSCVVCNDKKNLEPSENGLSCICNKHSRKVGYENDMPKCEQCRLGTILTSDRKNCIPCKKGENFTCECNINEVKVETDINGDLLKVLKCIECSENSYPSSDGLKCLNCYNDSINSHDNCACPVTTHVRIQNYCFRKNEIDLMDVRSTYLIHFSNENIDSYYLRKELRLSAYLCKDGDKKACERLSNICALTLSEKSVPCKISRSKKDSHTILWMFYEENGYPILVNNKIIPVKYSLDKTDVNNHLNFTIATFSLDGELKSIDTPNLFCTFLNNVRFGVNVINQCRVYAKDLTTREMNFFIPYLLYNDKGKTFLSTLPIFIKNKQWQLFKKFFLIDNISSYKAMPNLVDDAFKKEDNLSALRYIKSMEVLINVQNDRDGGHIYSPLIKIEFGELRKQDIQDNKQVEIYYKVVFILTNKNINNSIEIAIGVLSGFAIAYSALKAWSYCKRNYNGILNMGVIVWFFIYCISAIGNILLLVTTSVCIYTFIFYKGQTILHILLPTDSTESKIYLCTIIAFCFKAIEIIALIYRHRNINIFFIDWEQPRTIQVPLQYDSPRTSLKKLYNNRFEQDKVMKTSGSARAKKCSDEMSEENSPSVNKLSTIEKNFELYSFNDENEPNSVHNLSVSIWRTYFVANEWFKIQTKRRINMALQIIFTLFILEIVGLKYWTQATPELFLDQSQNHLLNEKNFTLRFGVGSLVYILCYCVQWIISITFYERYIKNRMQHFVDLCSVANISIFIFSYNYYGYYIHGRSVHGYADTDLETLISDLKKEENNLCAHRGLVPGTTNQTFIASLSSSFREIYYKLLDLQNSNESRFLRRNILESINWEKSFKTHSKIKRFFIEFIDHCFKNLDYIIKERLLIEKLCDIELGKNEEQSTFYIDNNNSFDRVIFYGNEWSLGTFEIALFIFVQALFEDYILACMVTLLISQLLITICRFNGKSNLAKKTLIDERFLM